MNCQSDISDLMCMMPCYGIMADVPAQSQHICSDVQDYEHQWSCWLHQHYWFVVVVHLGGVSPPFEPKPMVENNSGALRCIPCAHAHEHLSVHLVYNSSVALQPHSGASQPAGGSVNHVGEHAVI